MVPSEVAERIAADPRLIIPVGTCEHHGPHLPFGCDTIIVEHLADDLSAEFSVLRAPTFEFGVNAGTEHVHPGNATLHRKSLLRTLNDLLDSWEASGIREFILLTAHGHEAHQDALSTIVTKGARVRVIDILSIKLDDVVELAHGPLHGDEVDTSLLLFIAPHLVRMDLAQDYSIGPDALRRFQRRSFRVPRSSAGSLGRPTRASADKGKAIYARVREKIRARIFLAPPKED
jgi:creatinine amidohydrolase